MHIIEAFRTPLKHISQQCQRMKGGVRDVFVKFFNSFDASATSLPLVRYSSTPKRLRKNYTTPKPLEIVSIHQNYNNTSTMIELHAPRADIRWARDRADSDYHFDKKAQHVPLAQHPGAQEPQPSSLQVAH